MNSSIRWVLLPSVFLGEGLCTEDVKGSDTEKTLGIEDASLLEHLGSNWDGRVNRIGNDEDKRLGAELGNSLDEVSHNASVDGEEVVTGHSGLAFCQIVSNKYKTKQMPEKGGEGGVSACLGLRTRNSSWNEDEFTACEGIFQTFILWQVAGGFLITQVSPGKP